MAEIREKSRQQIVDVLVLALARSPLNQVGGIGALKGLLVDDPRTFPRHGVLDLTPVWELLEVQEGFEPKAALPGFCFMKNAEARLGITVNLPPQLARLTAHERSTHTQLCTVRGDELERIFNPELAPKKISLEQMAAAAPAPEAAAPALSPRRTAIVIASGVAILGAIAVVAVALYREYGVRQSWQTIAAKDFAGALPLASVQQRGHEVTAVVSDGQWFREPEEKRRGELADALRRLQALDAEFLIIKDAQESVRVTAQWSRNPRAPVVKFLK